MAVRFGQAGYLALGVAYGIIGALIVSMAVSYRPDTAVGLDAALTTPAAQTHGTALLLLVAAGLACFGVYCPFDARYRRGRGAHPVVPGTGRRRVHRRLAGVRWTHPGSTIPESPVAARWRRDQGDVRNRAPARSWKPTAPDGDAPLTEPSDVPDAPPAPRQRAVECARVGICTAALVSVALIVFMLQNTRSAEVSFLGLHGTLPMALALLIAAVGSAILSMVAGTARISQLRRLARQRRDQHPGQTSRVHLPGPRPALRRRRVRSEP